MDSERSRMSILTGRQQFRINSTYFQPSLTTSTPSSDPLVIPVKKGENFWEAALEGGCHFEGEQLKNSVYQVYCSVLFYAYGYDVGYSIMFLL